MLFVDAFLFESKAASEFIRDFVKRFFKGIFDESLSNSELAKRFAANEVPIEWLDGLKSERDFLLHNGGTWPVLEAVNDTYERFDLVLLKRILYTGSIEEKDTIHFDKLRIPGAARVSDSHWLPPIPPFEAARVATNAGRWNPMNWSEHGAELLQEFRSDLTTLTRAVRSDPTERDGTPLQERLLGQQRTRPLRRRGIG